MVTRSFDRPAGGADQGPSPRTTGNGVFFCRRDDERVLSTQRQMEAGDGIYGSYSRWLAWGSSLSILNVSSAREDHS